MNRAAARHGIIYLVDSVLSLPHGGLILPSVGATYLGDVALDSIN